MGKPVSSQTRALKFARYFNFHFPWPGKENSQATAKGLRPKCVVVAFVVVPFGQGGG